MNPKDKKASEMFRCSERERAVFEAGIKMATVFHQFVGTPVNAGSAPDLERAIERSVMVQPFTESAVIKIDLSRGLSRSAGKNGDGNIKNDRYNYASLTGDMIDAVIKVRVGNVCVTAEMRYNREMRYPLMYVSDVSS